MTRAKQSANRESAARGWHSFATFSRETRRNGGSHEPLRAAPVKREFHEYFAKQSRIYEWCANTIPLRPRIDSRRSCLPDSCENLSLGDGEEREREREKKSRSPGVRSWLAHCRCRADRKISRKFGAHHGNQSITTSSSKSTSRASRTFPLPCIQLLPDFQCYPFRGCIRQGTERVGREKKLYYRFNEVWPNSFIGEKVTCFAGGDPLLHRRNQISSSLILKLGAKCRRTRDTYEGVSSFG